ncbi:MAG: bifunctional folylpolyglutamate synthase/dihydrofolate synthase [Vicinamibacterales bacterium]|nr:bifunctional folylpolyglutamate synthase/dihydrofolate synthase [Vicinamibacterales bacterium]
MKFGLTNIRTICAALGQPQARYRCILVAGTNGKGSVTAMIDCALRAAGLHVGRYTSPHLVRLEERFAIDGQPVTPAVLLETMDRVRTTVDRLLAGGSLEAPPTFFEATTAIAFELFRQARVEFAVLEVGLGGRLDSTNIVDPVAVAITSIDFDHEQYLGTTLAAIAAEKAGVIRAGIPVVVGPVASEARNVLELACASARAEFVDAELAAATSTRTVEGRTILDVRTPHRDYGSIPLGLRGGHQTSNALVALRLLERLAAIAPIGPDAIVAGLRDVQWLGRLQMIEASGGRRALLDAAHNPAGTLALARYLGQEFPEPLPLVFGAMRDKNVASMLKTLMPAVSSLTITEPHNARAYSAEELAGLAREFSPGRRIDIAVEPREALDRAWAGNPLVCVAGSIFLVGDILSSLGPSVRNL